MTKEPKVFISYSHDNEQHKAWVIKLSTDLRARGVDANLDIWDLQPGQDIVRFMEDAISQSDRVLLVCSSQYVEKANKGTGGVGYERLIVTGELIGNIDTKKFIPILRNNTSAVKTPTFMGPRYYLDFSQDDAYETELEKLIREIYQSPALEKPPLGPFPYSKPSMKTEYKALPRPAFNPGEPSPQIMVDPWFVTQRKQADSGLANIGLTGAMEVAFTLSTPISRRQSELLDAVYKSQVHTFGWPIGVVLANRDDYRPKPRVDGITAEIGIPDQQSYDFWSLRSTGDFYLLKSLFEDMKVPNTLFFNTRIVRITEVLMFCKNLYTNLALSDDATIALHVAHLGLKGRILSTSNSARRLYPSSTTTEDIVETEITVRLGDMPTRLVDDVVRLAGPLFMVFDFQEFQRQIYEGLVSDFLAGKVT
jgi:hypothetical protein